ncbi:MAG: methyltransferase domain-containing protein, partial [Gammaproteobacteria bacterium]|nr:methyltransferase domain-containing protein [Gammaproteobacteria bacterium]NIU03240.1 methyltransferase domain-containing protein [Gammaproteobacteria bacterium]NIV50729.1 methyltransferase domain-containing protein [Gammaproteobacteria bacterium]NIW02681.1 methyltransferase domain-containing protein [Gammaproteobacteria bacterium]NIX84515.1 methyltransferase domain-containing protein [Gammaproteobacteria bacterium]
FDVVWVVECLEHLAAKGEFIRRAARTLVPGGRLALCSWQDGNGDADP